MPFKTPYPVTYSVTLKEFAGFLDSLSFFQSARKEVGPEEYSRWLNKFQNDVLKDMELPLNTNTADVPFSYELLNEVYVFQKQTFD